MNKAEIGIIGGSGLYSMPGLEKVREERVTTPFGEPSDALMLGELEEFVGASSTTEQEFDAILTIREINRALEDMDKEMRIAFVLRYFYGESILGICEKRNSSESKVKSMLFRARKRLHNHLKAKGVYV